MSFDMSKCKRGDKLVLRNGEVVEYLKFRNDCYYNYPHLIVFSDGGVGYYTDTGKSHIGDLEDRCYDVVAFLESSATNTTELGKFEPVVGKQLDKWGEVLDVERSGRSDDEYRLAIRNRITNQTLANNPPEVESHSHPKILIIGHARHGKDTFAQILADCWGFKFESSSMYCAENVIFPKLSSKYGYKTVEQCFEDRVNHRAEWKELISEFNQEDLTRLTKAILEINNIYVGMRGLDEFQACKEQGLFDLVVWVDDSYRKAPESKGSNELTRDLADVVVWNNGDINNLTLEACKVMRFLYDKRRAEYA